MRGKLHNIQIDPNISGRKTIESFVLGKEFDQLESSTCIHKNRRCITHMITFPGQEDRFILKHYRAGDEYPKLRKFSYHLRALRTNRAKKAFKGAKLLRAAGIQTVEPLACWSMRRKPWIHENYFLYRMVEGCYPLSFLAEQALKGIQTKDYKHLFNRMVEIVQTLHMAGLYHGDIATHNFIVVEKTPADTQCSSEHYDLVLIDTDRVCRIPLLLGSFLRSVLDMRCLRRLDFPEEERRRFLKAYFGDTYTEFWHCCLKIWKLWGSRPFSRLRGTVKGMFESPDTSLN